MCLCSEAKLNVLLQDYGGLVSTRELANSLLSAVEPSVRKACLYEQEAVLSLPDTILQSEAKLLLDYLDSRQTSSDLTAQHVQR
jgi:hypothetical protein